MVFQGLLVTNIDLIESRAKDLIGAEGLDLSLTTMLMGYGYFLQ